MCREIRELEIGKIVILSEGNQIPEFASYPSVYKYQATADVLREVMACYGEEKRISPSVFSVLKNKTQILGIYSPLGRCLKTSLALTIGQILAKERAVLYLNFETCAGFETLLGRSFPHTLSDLFYYAKQEDPNLLFRMNSMVQTVNGLDMIAPVQAGADILGVSWEDLERVLQEIILHSSYEVLVLDIGTAIADLCPLLDLCGQIYMPVLDDCISRAKLLQFENLLKAWDYTQVLSKIQKLVLPQQMSLASSDAYVEKLPFSELGTYVKHLLRENGKMG
jgi:cellulose biosynthesis protein BcsQ